MKLLDCVNLKQAFLPVDLITAAITGARIGLSTGNRVAAVINFGDSTGANVVVSLKQSNAATSGTTKALSVALPYYYKAGTDTHFTKVIPDAATDVYDLSSIFAAQEGIVVFEIEAQDLDVDGGFTHFSINLADGGTTGAEKIASAVYHLSENRQEPAYSVDI